MRLLKKCTALFTCLGFAGASLLCVAPVSTVTAETELPFDPETAFLEVCSVASTVVEPNPNEIAVLAAQAGLAYAFANAPDSDVLHGNSKQFAGYCLYQGATYFGAAYINDSGTVCCADIHHSADSVLGVDSSFHCVSSRSTEAPYNTMACRSFPSSSSPEYYNQYTYTICTVPWAFRSVGIVSSVNGDPCGRLHVGKYPDSLTGVTGFFEFNSNYSVVCFSKNYIDLSTTFTDLGGVDFSTDLSQLQGDLQETYPDVQPEFYITPGGEDPTEETTEETTEDCCGCTHIINIEPTINVDVNVEPTINVNVDVDVENPLPSEWLETIPTETVENPFEELPTLDVENFTDILQDPEDTFPETSGFWWKNFELWIKDNEKLWKYFLGLFTIGVVGFILRKLG